FDFWRRQGSWWSPRSSKPTRPSSLVWRVRFPSASANFPTKGLSVSSNPRRSIPSTDRLLAIEEVVRAKAHLAPHKIVQIIHRVQADARSGQIAPNNVAAEVINQVQSAVTTELSPVLNATGVIRSEEHTSELQS